MYISDPDLGLELFKQVIFLTCTIHGADPMPAPQSPTQRSGNMITSYIRANLDGNQS